MAAPTQTLFPVLTVQDPDAAIAWLAEALGAEAHLVVRDDAGAVQHAEIRVGHALVLLASAPDPTYGTRSPHALGATTAGVYVVADDVQGAFDRAQSAGASVVQPLRQTDYGSTDFSVRDPEGHLWHVGSYHPGA